MTTTLSENRPRHQAPWPVLGVAALLVALVASVFVGAADITVRDVLTGGLTEAHRVYLLEARLPRTAAAALAGASLAVAGLLMQLLTRNRFVEPSTAGTVESAGLGLVVVAILAPGAPIVVKMLVAMVFALVVAFPLSLVLFKTLRRRVNEDIAAVDEKRRRDREDLQSRLRGE